MEHPTLWQWLARHIPGLLDFPALPEGWVNMQVVEDVAASGAVVLAALALRLILLRVALRKKVDMTVRERRRWESSIRTLTTTALILGLLLIWAPQLQTFAITLTAVMLAIVIATKELILCLTGGVYKSTSDAFKVGDWVEIPHFPRDIVGEVIERGVLFTRLQEAHKDGDAFSHSGRMIVVPNKMFLECEVINHGLAQNYGLLDIRLPVHGDKVDIKALRKALEKTMKQTFRQFADEVIAYANRINGRYGVCWPVVEPELHELWEEADKLVFSAQMLAPVRRHRQIRLALHKEVSEAVAAYKDAAQAEARAAREAALPPAASPPPAADVATSKGKKTEKA